MNDGSYAYLDPSSDDSILHSIEPSLVDLKSLMISQVNINSLSNQDDDVKERRTFVSHDRHVKVSEGLIADRFCIGLKRARATLKATLQRGTRLVILPLSRR